MKLTLERVAEYIAWSHAYGSGGSARTLLSFATGLEFTPPRDMWEPRDSGDLGRCIDMLRKFPEARCGLEIAAQKHKGWAFLVAEWDELERLYDFLDRAIGEDFREKSYVVYNKMRILRGDEPIEYKPETKKKRKR